MSEYWTEKDVMENAILDLQHENDDLRTRIGELEQAHRWIPVSERLIPGEGEVVLGYVDKSHLPTMVMFFEGEFVLVKSNKAPYERITHWMPLPTPPEDE